MHNKFKLLLSILLPACLILLSSASFGSDKTKSNNPKNYHNEETVNASDFGVKPNSFENASAGIKKAIEYCRQKPNVTLLLPGGRIDLWPEGAYQKELYISNATESDTLSKVKNIAFLFDGFNNINIEGNNTLVVLHGKMVSFALLNSSAITIKNVRFDYERPTMSELTVQSVSPQSVTVSVHPDSRFYIDNGLIDFYGEGWKSKNFHTIVLKPEENRMLYSSFKPFLQSKATQTGPLQVKFDGDFSKTNFQTGDIITVRDPYRDNAGGFINRSTNIKLQDVFVYYMHGMGIVSQFSENISFIKVSVRPRENSGRVISSFADCFHFSGCKGKILIDSCFTSGTHDDPINVHGTHLKITSIVSKNKVRLAFMHHQTYGFEAFFAGDSIAFVNPQTLLSLGQAVVKNAMLINKKEMEIELNDPLPATIKEGDCIENITWTPELTVRNSHFERTNTRGILVTTRRKVLIENNTFFRTGMHPILIADDALSWYESGPVQDVTIRNNRFEECGYNSAPGNYIIAIAPENHQQLPGKYVHRNIRIENNFFKVFDTPVLTAKSVDGLVFSNNTISRSELLTGANNKPTINLVGCNNVIVRNNIFPVQEKPVINFENMTAKQLKADISVVSTGIKAQVNK